KQIVIIYAAVNGYLDGIETSQGAEFEKGLAQYMDTAGAATQRKLAEKKVLDDEIKGELKTLLEQYRDAFAARGAATVAAQHPHHSSRAMPNLRDIRTRIRSIKNTQQLTYTMKLVSATKLRRTQEQILAARPYARQMLRVLNSLATRAQPESHPLLQQREERKVEMVVITADRGLCGGFNANILKAALAE